MPSFAGVYSPQSMRAVHWRWCGLRLRLCTHKMNDILIFIIYSPENRAILLITLRGDDQLKYHPSCSLDLIA